MSKLELGRSWRSLSAMALAAVLGTAACSDRIDTVEPTPSAPAAAPIIQGASAELAATFVQMITPPNQNATSICGAVDTQVPGAGPFSAALRPSSNLAGSYTFNDGTATVTLTNGNLTVSWSTDFDYDYVVVHAGGGQTDYVYAGDSHSGSVTLDKGFSNITFCVGAPSMDLDASATTSTGFDRKYSWGITKTADPSSVTMEAGGSANVSYTVTATTTGSTDSGFEVSGTVTVTNNTYMTATGVNVSVAVAGAGSASCLNGASIIGAGNSTTCNFGPVSVPDNSNRAVTATVTANSPHSGGAGAGATAVFGAPTSVTDATVDVTDSHNGGPSTSLGTATQPSGAFTYSATITAPAAGYYDPCPTVTESNTASFAAGSGATGSASASVAVTVAGNCGLQQLDAGAAGAGTFKRTYSWSISKEPAEQLLSLAVGQSANVTWTVSVSSTSTDSDYQVSGTVTINNPNGVAAPVAGLAVSLSGSGAVSCTPAITSVPANGSASCSFSTSATDASAQSVSVTVTNGAFGPASGSAAFGAPFEVDNSVTVTDTYNGGSTETIGTVSAPGGSISYSKTVGPFTVAVNTAPCPSGEIINRAAFTAGSGATGNAAAVVGYTVSGECGKVIIPPQPPNTCGIYSQGYWKNHVSSWPFPSSTILFGSGKSWLAVFNTSANGNPWYILAYQYMASVLNGTSNANVAQAAAYLSTYTPTQAAAKNFAYKSQMTALAASLEQYISQSEAGCAAYLAWVRQYGNGGQP